MSIKTLIYIGVVWLFLNAIIPILFRSLERIYQRQIDLFVKGFVSILRLSILILMQGFLILLYLPTIILGTFFIWLLPEIFSKEALEKKRKEGKKISRFIVVIGDSFHLIRILLRRDFWDIALPEIKLYIMVSPNEGKRKNNRTKVPKGKKERLARDIAKKRKE